MIDVSLLCPKSIYNLHKPAGSVGSVAADFLRHSSIFLVGFQEFPTSVSLAILLILHKIKDIRVVFPSAPRDPRTNVVDKCKNDIFDLQKLCF